MQRINRPILKSIRSIEHLREMAPPPRTPLSATRRLRRIFETGPGPSSPLLKPKFASGIWRASRPVCYPTFARAHSPWLERCPKGSPCHEMPRKPTPNIGDQVAARVKDERDRQAENEPVLPKLAAAAPPPLKSQVEDATTRREAI